MRKKLSYIALIIGLFIFIGWTESQAQPIHPAQKISIANLTLTSANTVYFAVKARTSNPWKIAFSEGTSGTTYETVPAGGIWFPDHPLLLSTNRIFYVQSSTAGLILEIEIYQ